MAFIKPIPAADAKADVKKMYQTQQSAFGYVPGYAKVFCYRPEVMALWADLQRGIRKHQDAKRFELVTLAAATALRSTNCAMAHSMKLKKYLSNKELGWLLAGDGFKKGIITEAEAAAMELARKVATDASAVEQADIDELIHLGLTEAEVFDVVATAAARAFFTKIVDGLGGLADHNYPELCDELKLRLSTGRPLKVGEREHV